MKSLLISILFSFMLIASEIDRKAQAPVKTSEAAMLELRNQANEAHKAGHVGEEINCRQQLSRREWDAYALAPKALTEYDAYAVVFFNDLPLALLLEGTGRFAEAHQVLRHNQAELASERVAGNDIKAENDLQFAHLLRREGRKQEAEAICSHWKPRMRHLAGRQDSAHIYGIPPAPVYDTPEVETAKWEFACGSPATGLKLVAEQMVAHPHMLASFDALRKYYTAEGDFDRARTAESDGRRAVTGSD